MARPGLKTLRLAALVVSGVLVASRALAQDLPPESYALAQGDCLAAQGPELDHLLAIELSAPNWSRQVDATWAVQLRCSDPGLLVLVKNTRSGVENAKYLDLSELDRRVVARVVALAIAELLERSRTWTSAPPLPKTAAPQQPTKQVLQREERRRPSLWAVASLRKFPSAVGISTGLGVRSVLPVTRSWGISAGILAERGSASQNVGSVKALSGSADFAARFELSPGAVTLAAEAGGRLGYVRLEGSPEAGVGLLGGSVSGIWGGPQLSLFAAIPLGRDLRLAARTEGGAMLLRVKGHAPEPVWSGAWVAGELALGWQF